MAVFTLSKFIFLYILFTLKEPIILSQKRSPGKSNKLNECQRCKVLTDSFNTWLDRTSRGKHEGGDVAWEEAKLKSYARSEMRLVEIQEGLCSELKTHQEHCYALSEESEQVLEKWWFNENNVNSDLYTWLCIENLQHCCPANHFGDACTPCLRDKNNRVCGGKGQCDGDGTRTGNGTCICNKGYSGSYCDECSANFYSAENVCKPCHKACNECHSDGPNACVQCARGWSSQSGVCVDVNECLDDVCKAKEFCINSEGSYMCKRCDKTCSTCVGPGPGDCTTCEPDNVLWIGKCMSNDRQRLLLKNVWIRAAVYLCLCILVVILSRKSWLLASVVLVSSAVFIYYIENTSDIMLINVYNHYF